MSLKLDELGFESQGEIWIEIRGEEQPSTHIPGSGVNVDEFVRRMPQRILVEFGNWPESEPFDSEEEQQGSFEEPLSEDPISEQ